MEEVSQESVLVTGNKALFIGRWVMKDQIKCDRFKCNCGVVSLRTDFMSRLDNQDNYQMTQSTPNDDIMTSFKTCPSLSPTCWPRLTLELRFITCRHKQGPALNLNTFCSSPRKRYADFSSYWMLVSSNIPQPADQSREKYTIFKYFYITIFYIVDAQSVLDHLRPPP